MSHLFGPRFVKIVGCVLFVGVFVVVATRRADAQATPSPFAEVLAALAELQSTVEQLLPGDPETVRFTPAAFVDGAEEVIDCRAVNVSDATRTIRTDIQGEFTNGLPFSLPARDNELGAGEIGDELFYIVGTDTRLTAYCKFTVVNGSADDIRASLVIMNTLGERISLPAE